MRALLNRLCGWLGEGLAAYLTRPRARYTSLPVAEPHDLQDFLQPCDVLLVEGSAKVSTAIKYLTQSTWSHACLYIGREPGLFRDGEPATLIEADIKEGVRAVPLSHYSSLNTRICRPVGLTAEDRRRVVAFVLERVGHRYDLRNVIDLLRYLIPTPPVPARFRGELLELGSGEPTRAICSTLIAQAFQHVHYPVLPIAWTDPVDPGARVFAKRHHSFFTPRDFDLSPYFATIKPTLLPGFDYRSFPWHRSSEPTTGATEDAGAAAAAERGTDPGAPRPNP